MIQYTGWIGGPEIIIILVVVLLLFGGKKIPELAKGLGKGIRDFKKAADDSNIKSDIKDVASEINDLKSSVDKINPKKVVKFDNVSKPKQKGG
ncbi:MAG: twin-arginine translocase TatA/TatE family subunit [Bacteroidetes bacterium]|nr:twin-arginine translocase TatA/TatE family subunit [Bacteroidota bacterium]MBL6944064.1 twin-arginine translocase TatA/TatE family subunit [Bacteroidales bacterium]